MATTVVLWGGVDPGGQAGLAADLQAAHALGAQVRLVVTALTAQTSGSWLAGWPVADRTRAEIVRHLDLPEAGLALKSGMLAKRSHARAAAQLARQRPAAPWVVDPLQASSSGGSLWPGEDLTTLPRFLLRDVLPHAHAVTPNWPELAWLTGTPLRDLADAERALRGLPCPVVLKGGHAPEDLRGTDWVWDGVRLLALPATARWQRSPRGTGCRFATALAIGMASGQSLHDAAAAAKALVADLTAASRA